MRRNLAVAVSAGLSILLAAAFNEVETSAQGGLEVVASGLDNPHGLAFGPEGVLYVAQAGRGGDGPCVVAGDGRTVCLGLTGRISRLWRGAVEDVVSQLPSLAPADGSAAIGPYDVTFQGRGNGYAMMGVGGDPDNRGALGDDGTLLGRVLRFTPDGRFDAVADGVELEQAYNPHPVGLDTNPYAITAGPHGVAFVDAGGNDAWLVAANGSVSLLALFPDRTATAPWGAPIPMQAVPTAIAIGSDGAYYIGQLTGFPFPVGGANVYRVVPGEAPTVFASGFTNIVDLAFGPDGSLFVLEFAANGLLSGDPTSAVHRVWPNGAHTTVPTPGLILATGLAVDRDGALFVSAFGVVAGGGQIVKIQP